MESVRPTAAQRKLVLRTSPIGLLCVCLLVLAGCAPNRHGGLPSSGTLIGPLTSTAGKLGRLPPAPRRLNVAVYDFPDQTGALRPVSNTTTVVDFSKAVTQGAASVLVDTLKLVGNGTWFNVVERSRLDHLLRERSLVQDTYKFVRKSPDELISPLEFAEYLIEGGITSFDSNIGSGGIVARYLGIGPSLTYQRNFVTVTLRIVNVRTGQVVTSVTASKTIFSVGAGLNVTKFVTASNNLLEVEAALSASEPTQIAVREAIEAGVIALINRAEAVGMWSRPSAVGISRPAFRAAFRRSIDPGRPGKSANDKQTAQQQQQQQP